MFKLVVLCAFLAAGAAEPEPEPKPSTLITTPFLSSYSTILSPASTTITKQASSIVHPSPYYVSSPLVYPHFIKKRSATLPFTYFASSPYAYASAPLATTYTAPLYNAAPILPAAPALPYVATHLIKKRSAHLLPTTYIAPATYAAHTPLLASTYSSPLIASPHLIPQPLISQPLVSTHFIKKRSAPILPLVNTYIAPSSFSHQSRIDLHGAPIAAFPSLYSHPIAYSHVL